MVVKKDVDLSLCTTMGIGGKAKYFVSAGSINELKSALTFAKNENLSVFVFSGGSNTVFSDHEYEGLVIKVSFEGIEVVKENKNSIFFKVLAGTKWDKFVAYCVNNGYQGVEFLSGIPGSVGATPVQNVGAYGQEVSQTIAWVECIHRKSQKTVTLQNSECNFSYRDSIFKKHTYLVVTHIVFKLRKSLHTKIEYPSLLQKLQTDQSTLKKVRTAVIELRKEKSMIVSKADPNAKSVGSFFKNPIIGKSKFKLLRQKHPDIPYWKVGSLYKVSAAWLVESSGFFRGYTHKERVAISTKHSLAIVNKNNAGSNDLVEFVKLIQNTVRNKFSITLDPEPVLVGINL